MGASVGDFGLVLHICLRVQPTEQRTTSTLRDPSLECAARVSQCTRSTECSPHEHFSPVAEPTERSVTMGWPYHFLDLTPDEKSHRRELLAQYAFYSQLSALIPILGYGVYRLCVEMFARKGAFSVVYSALRQSPGTAESARESEDVSFNAICKRWRSVQWWLHDEVAPDWGLRGRWIAAFFWTFWLLLLCVLRTGHGKQISTILASRCQGCPSNVNKLSRKPQHLHLNKPRSLEQRDKLLDLLNTSSDFPCQCAKYFLCNTDSPDRLPPCHETLRKRGRRSATSPVSLVNANSLFSS